MMHAVGGTSIHYWAQSWRLNPWDFKVSARLPDAMARRESLGARPSRTGRLVWTRSSTSSASPGRPATSRGAGIYSRDLACEYPMPPLRGTEFTELMAVTARKLGRHPFAGPAAIDSQGYDDRPGCMYHGFCSCAGCPVSAKNSTAVSTIPRPSRPAASRSRPWPPLGVSPYASHRSHLCQGRPGVFSAG
jgi:hypothetical protein